MLSILLGLYFSSLILFSFVSNPVVYCVLLMLGALSVSAVSYVLMGFSWYLVLFCLVYVGGVYVLFIFVSVRNPNPMPSVGGGFTWLVGSGACLILVSLGLSWNVPLFSEGSYYLCSYFEGFSYCLFCLVLMLGFVCVSVVIGEKDSFFR